MQDWLDIDEGELPRVDTCNSMSITALLTAQGLGISLLPEQLYQSAIATGELVPIATTPEIPMVEFSSVYPRVPPNASQKSLSEVAARVSTFLTIPTAERRDRHKRRSKSQTKVALPQK